MPTIALAEVLDMPSDDSFPICGDCQTPYRFRPQCGRDDAPLPSYTNTVRETFPVKRGYDHYPELLESMKRYGQDAPILIINGSVMNGHHRIAAAIELGWPEIEYTSNYGNGWVDQWPEEREEAMNCE